MGHSEMLGKSVSLYLRADMLIEGLSEVTTNWLAGTRYVDGIAREINEAGNLLELSRASELGRFHFESGSIFFPWLVVAFIDVKNDHA